MFFDRAKNKLLRIYWSYVFKKSINECGSNLSILGKPTLINRNIKIGNNVTIYPGCMFFDDGLINIGNNVDIGNNTIIYASKSGGVSIGDNTMIAADCYIIDTDHGTKSGELIRNQKNIVSEVKIGQDCWLAANVTALKGSHIGDGAVIGAKSLVKNCIDSNSIAFGNPAKKYKER